MGSPVRSKYILNKVTYQYLGQKTYLNPCPNLKNYNLIPTAPHFLIIQVAFIANSHISHFSPYIEKKFKNFLKTGPKDHKKGCCCPQHPLRLRSGLRS
jgi:hypothetical protein